MGISGGTCPPCPPPLPYAPECDVVQQDSNVENLDCSTVELKRPSVVCTRLSNLNSVPFISYSVSNIKQEQNTHTVWLTQSPLKALLKIIFAEYNSQ